MYTCEKLQCRCRDSSRPCAGFVLLLGPNLHPEPMHTWGRLGARWSPVVIVPCVWMLTCNEDDL